MQCKSQQPQHLGLWTDPLCFGFYQPKCLWNMHCFRHTFSEKCTQCCVSLLSAIFFFCWTQSHFPPFCSPVQCHRAFRTWLSLLTCNRMKGQEAATAALRTKEISRERKRKMEERMERWRKREGVEGCFLCHCSPILSPENVTLPLGGSAPSRDSSVWPHLPRCSVARSTALCLPTNTPHADCFPWTWSSSHKIEFILERYHALNHIHTFLRTAARNPRCPSYLSQSCIVHLKQQVFKM